VSKQSQKEDIVDEILVEREDRGLLTALTMVYRPYNLLGPKSMEALAGVLSQISQAGEIDLRVLLHL
jgi:hypothetical protein